MNVLHIGTERSWRGGENQIRHLLEGLARRGAACHVAYPRGSEGLKRFGALAVAELVELPSPWGFDPRSIARIYRYCRRHRIDLIDAHSSPAHALGLTLKRTGLEFKFVVHRRIPNKPRDRIVTRQKYRSSQVDRYVAISRAIKQVLVDYGVEAERISVVPSGVDSSVYESLDPVQEKRRLTAELGLSPETLLLGNASAMTHQKGYEDLLAAVARLKESERRFHCIIAGDGAKRDELEELARKLRLGGHVRFLGFIEDVPRLLSALDILVVPSRWEGLGTLILEGLYAGCAVAATRVGGIPEAIAHEETGLLSEARDPEGLAANVGRLIDDAELRTRLNAAGVESISKKFSLDAMVDGNRAVYASLLNGGS